jgi:hypothetical protein
MDPQFMKEVDERYGPLEWRLPEAHAIYWAAKGLDEAERHPGKVNKDDLIQLRRVIYQTMLLAFQRGRLEVNPIEKAFDFGPNLDIIPNANKAYEGQMLADPEERNKMETGHRNFLRQAIYSLYVYNRINGPGTNNAAAWFKYLAEKYPNKTIIDGDTNSYPRNVTLDEYALSNLQVDITETSRDRVKAAVEGLLRNAYVSLALDQDDRYAGFYLLAKKVLATYDEKIPQDRKAAIGLPPINDIAREVLDKMLNVSDGIPPEARAVLRTKLRMKSEIAPTNAVPETVSPPK